LRAFNFIELLFNGLPKPRIVHVLEKEGRLDNLAELN
jgi:hypothetical protein